MSRLDTSEFRRLMGFWATGVSVITARGSHGPAGATANALSSLSLDPPLVLACFDTSSRTLHAVRESQRFAINMLSIRQVTVAQMFATKRAQEDKFREVRHHLEHGAPVIEGSLAWVVCRLDAESTHGDHIVAIGGVLACELDPGAEPLLFYRGRYATLGGDAPA
jgi:3-hydroxy-9,10-secoandrosta-1,3,5(10)-triene-9,17-dione monooxygenase reductase component